MKRKPMKRTGLAVMSLALATALNPALAQVSSETLKSISVTDRVETGPNDGNSTTATAPAVTSETTAPPSAPDTPPTGGAAKGGEWHFSVSPYLWLPGVHGTVGAFGRDAGLHASAIDLLSHLRFGLMGNVEARRGMLVLPVDMFWVRLGDDSAVPFPGLAASSANVKVSEFILTPKVGLRVLDTEKLKFDVLAGFRYWHLGQKVQFSPSLLNLNFSRSQNLVDPVVGGRMETVLSHKFVVNILGDVGGWGTGSTLEYQVAGLIGYRIKENMTLQAGYRYLDLNYLRGGSRPAVYDVAMSGVALGITINLK